MEQAKWWEKRWFLALLVFASAIPLLWPETPPLVDVPGHMGRFRVQLELQQSSDLQRYFDFQWALVGNLGVDLLVQWLGPILGLEPAVKLVVLIIPPLTVVGIFWIAKEIHGRIPPTVFFAIPFAYSFSFNFGFLNYCLSIALALVAFGFWLRLTRLRRLRIRAITFVPISCLLWLTHAFGWGIFGLLAFSAEVVRLLDKERRVGRAFIGATLSMVPLGLPLVAMVAGQGTIVGGPTENFFDLPRKGFALIRSLRDRWLLWDCYSLAVPAVLIGASIFDERLNMARRLRVSLAFIAFAFLLLPVRILGLDYADIRLASLIFLIALIAIRPAQKNLKTDRALAWLGIAFVTLRLAGNGISYAIADRELRHQLEALRYIPQGAPVLWLTGEYCGMQWEMPRQIHIGSFVIVRKRGFANGQWQAQGAQLLRIHVPGAGKFQEERAGFVYSEQCLRTRSGEFISNKSKDRRLVGILSDFPRSTFSHVWMVNVPNMHAAARDPGLRLVWRGENSALYQVRKLHRSALPN